MKKHLSNPWLQGGLVVLVFIGSFPFLPSDLVKWLSAVVGVLCGGVILARQDKPKDRAFPAGLATIAVIAACLVFWAKVIH